MHRNRGRRSNRAKSTEFKQRVLARYKARYEDFGPTLASEHLSQDDGLEVDHETLRRWLIGEQKWTVQRRRQKHRQWRERKPCRGQLVQMDGSHHDWFEGRRAKAVLMVMVDDASNRTYARFAEEETTRAAYEVFEGYVRRYGLPQALYVDRDSIYETTREPSLEEELRAEQPLTQFGRAMGQLGVELVLAYSPQAKGRVERCNGVLQDRLVKEMRLEKISDLEKANEFLEKKFLPQLNRKFCVAPAQEADVHRSLPRGLKEVLSWEDQRVVQRDWTVSCKGRHYQLGAEHEGLCLAGKKVTVRELKDGKVQLLWRGQKLGYRELAEKPKAKREPRKVVQSRELRPPRQDHPWREFGVGAGGEFWRQEKARGRAARQAFRQLRSASASLRPSSVAGMPAGKEKCAQPTKGTFSPELIRGHF